MAKKPALLFWLQEKIQHCTPDECLLWPFAKDKAGYGKLYFDAQCNKAHRVAYRLANDDLRSHLVVMHKCDTPLCVNPFHLAQGTQRDNALDMHAKGRGRIVGPKPKLTAEQVREIRASAASNKSLARQFGVCVDHISRIKHHHTWKKEGMRCAPIS